MKNEKLKIKNEGGGPARRFCFFIVHSSFSIPQK